MIMKQLKLSIEILMKGRDLLVSVGESHEFSGLVFPHLVVKSAMVYRDPVTASVSIFA